MSIESIPLSDIQRSDPNRFRRPNQVPRKERRLVATLLNLYETAAAEKRKFTKAWPTVYRFYMGEQWGNRPQWKASIVENHVFGKIETMVPILTDNRPRIEINPREPQYMEYARLLQIRMDYIWRRRKVDRTVVCVTKNTLLYGKGFYYIYWDSDAEEIAIESVDPQAIFPDPDATTIEDSRYLVHVAQMSRDEIIETWPEAEGKLRTGDLMVPRPGAYKSQIRDEAKTSERFRVGYEYAEEAGGARSTLTSWVKANDTGDGTDEDMIQVLQFWIRDPEVTEEKLLDPVTGEVVMEDGEPWYVRSPKYPGGRHVVVACDRIIHDDQNPFLHKRFPYVEQECHIMPGEFWPVSAAQNLIPLQKALNKVNSQILDNAALMGNNQWLVSRDSGITADTVTGQPGEVVTKNSPNSYAERLPAPTLPSYIGQMSEALREALDNVSGVFDVTQGRKPSGITAGVAIEQLQEAGHTRIRLLVRNLEMAIADLGEQAVALMQQFYTEPRTVRVTNRDTGQVEFQLMTPEMIQGQWEVEVAAGSTLPRSREVRQKEAIELYKLGLFDEEAALEHIDHPGREELLRRLRQQRQMQIQMAMASGAGPDVLMQILGGHGGGAPGLPAPGSGGM